MILKSIEKSEFQFIPYFLIMKVFKFFFLQKLLIRKYLFYLRQFQSSFCLSLFSLRNGHLPPCKVFRAFSWYFGTRFPMFLFNSRTAIAGAIIGLLLVLNFIGALFF